MRGKAHNWSGVDWTLADKEIARQLGAGESTVRNKRAEAGIQKAIPNPSKHGYGSAINLDWFSVNWGDSERVLANKLGVSRCTVRRIKASPIPELVRELVRLRAKYSERKTVHEWLNMKGVPREEFGKPICLLRRLYIALDMGNQGRDVLEKAFSELREKSAGLLNVSAPPEVGGQPLSNP